ncbi:MAG: YetF domain-containing protein [Gemmatimonadota bacterium]
MEMFFQGWEGIVRTLVVGTLAYLCLVCFLLISGKRTLAKLNAFDLVVTVALGSTVSIILLQQGLPLAEGITALALLIGLQYLVTATSVRWEAFARSVRRAPSLLVRNGEYCRDTLRRERVTEREVLSAVRASGVSGIEDAAAVFLESDGTMSVIKDDGGSQEKGSEPLSGT